MGQRRHRLAAGGMAFHLPFRAGGLALLAGTLALVGPRAAAGSEDSGRAAVERYLGFAQAARDEVLREDRCPYDPAAVVMRCGIDPEALSAFVREKIAYEPYRGIVRGPQGTLAAGSGGDWDRANLLREILGHAGFQTRLLVIERTEKEAPAAVDAFLAQDPRLRTVALGQEVDESKLPPPAAVLASFGIPPANRAIHLRRGAARWRMLLDASFDAAAIEARRIEKVLAAAKLLEWQSLDAWRASLVAGARQRVLVEVTNEGATKVFSAGPERDLPPADRLESAVALDAPPDEEIARFGLTLIVRAGGEGAEPVTLLERTEHLGSLFVRPIRLEIVPVDAKAAAAPVARWSQPQWYQFVSGFNRFQAIVRLGDAWEGSKVFDLAGRTYDVSPDGRVAGATEVGGAARRGFGVFGGGDEDDAKAAKATLEALTLEMELLLPGEEPLRQERLIFGKLRNDVSPVFTADILACGGPVGPATLAWLTADAVTFNAPLLARVLLSDDPRRFDAPADVKRLPGMLHEWQLGRIALADRAMAAGGGDLSLLGGPACILGTVQFRADAKDKQVTLRVALDVAFDHQKVLPRTARGGEAAPRANLALGVGSTVLESAILRGHFPDAMARGAYPESQAACIEGLDPIAGPAEEDGSVGKAAPAPRAAWSMGRNEKGRTLIVPRPQGAVSWWSIDPATGAAIGRGEGGEGQTAIEYLSITKMNLSNLKCMLAWMNAMMGNQRDPAAAMAWVACITGVDNPGGPIASAGGVATVWGYEATGGALSMMGDALGGFLDASDLVEKHFK